jgi:16S rRNA (guanine527-N7)-methyltransferase
MFRELLAKEFAPFGILAESQLAQLEEHYQLLCNWNKRINLTRILSLEDTVRLHYCESLFLGRTLPPGRLKIADVGSGAGFPGIPLAIFRPELSVALIESHQRKAVFLREASRRLSNVAVISDRAENIRERFDWVVSRAVAPAEVVNLDLAPSFAILVGAADAQKLGEDWEMNKVPWGERRLLALFHVKHAKI